MRTVIVLCGPPGAGKTTAARASGLQVFDRDDPCWSSEREFNAALTALATNHAARAVVIRSGATSTARARVARQVGATGIYVLTADREELLRRIGARGRGDEATTRAGVKGWYDRFDGRDGVKPFPGWPAVLASGDLDAGVTSGW